MGLDKSAGCGVTVIAGYVVGHAAICQIQQEQVEHRFGAVCAGDGAREAAFSAREGNLVPEQPVTRLLRFSYQKRCLGNALLLFPFNP